MKNFKLAIESTSLQGLQRVISSAAYSGGSGLAAT